MQIPITNIDQIRVAAVRNKTLTAYGHKIKAQDIMRNPLRWFIDAVASKQLFINYKK